jgi:hypothetical protein
LARGSKVSDLRLNIGDSVIGSNQLGLAVVVGRSADVAMGLSDVYGY